ncbi:hypothetical protein [Streptomyces sp. UG1]|uniref:hypothetical protein n=1 Tax=Streptomyces sp. UG1 TaxID=3417652 RepID=UPI003CEE335D
MWPWRTWLRLVGRDLATGLAALGQAFGAFTTPECYGFGPVGGASALDAGCAPGLGHPEHVVDVPLSALSDAEQAVWRQLDDVWE